MIVVDTNIIVYFWISGEFTEVVEQVFLKDPDWHVPLLWRSEFRNVLTGLFRKTRIRFDIALEILENAENQFREKEYLVPSWHVMKCVETSPCSAYDCEFIALAIQLGVPLVTNDRQILLHFPQNAVTPQAFLEKQI